MYISLGSRKLYRNESWDSLVTWWRTCALYDYCKSSKYPTCNSLRECWEIWVTFRWWKEKFRENIHNLTGESLISNDFMSAGELYTIITWWLSGLSIIGLFRKKEIIRRLLLASIMSLCLLKCEPFISFCKVISVKYEGERNIESNDHVASYQNNKGKC
mgnify:CR=1 FL=1